LLRIQPLQVRLRYLHEGTVNDSVAQHVGIYISLTHHFLPQHHFSYKSYWSGPKHNGVEAKSRGTCKEGRDLLVAS